MCSIYHVHNDNLMFFHCVCLYVYNYSVHVYNIILHILHISNDLKFAHVNHYTSYLFFFCISSTSWLMWSSINSIFSFFLARARCNFTILSIRVCLSTSTCSVITGYSYIIPQKNSEVEILKWHYTCTLLVINDMCKVEN